VPLAYLQYARDCDRTRCLNCLLPEPRSLLCGGSSWTGRILCSQDVGLLNRPFRCDREKQTTVRNQSIIGYPTPWISVSYCWLALFATLSRQRVDTRLVPASAVTSTQLTLTPSGPLAESHRHSETRHLASIHRTVWRLVQAHQPTQSHMRYGLLTDVAFDRDLNKSFLGTPRFSLNEQCSWFPIVETGSKIFGENGLMF